MNDRVNASAGILPATGVLTLDEIRCICNSAGFNIIQDLSTDATV